MDRPSRQPRDPFPPRTTPTVRVDSTIEERAFIAAYPSPAGPWQVTSQMLVTPRDRPEDHLTLSAVDGTLAIVRFDVASFLGHQERHHPDDGLSPVLRTATEFGQENGPHHPGSLARFPVPSARYGGQVEVPLAILAVNDDGRRGLYAPDRVVVLTWPEGAPVGIGPYPGFDPERWPPPRLGDWPPPGISRVEPNQLQSMVARFSGCWIRLVSAFLSDTDYPHRRDEAAEARTLVARLDPDAMLNIYDQLSPEFWAWLG